jgi:ATP-dependent protease HslVU (ClpYQ) peptidase subunit
MTTLVVVRKHNEVAIAADSLTTFGDTRLSAQFDRIYDKIVHYRDTYIGLCGSAAHQLVFESLLAQHQDLEFGSKQAIFETFRKLHPILKDQHFLNPKEEEDDPYESTQITALIANGSGIFGVYSSTRSSGRSARGASSRWERCKCSTAACAPRRRSPGPGSRPAQPSTRTPGCR